MEKVIPYYELHIRPMFRLIDRDHMLWNLDLWNYESVKSHAPLIQEFLSRPAPGFMPTPDFGGPWPQEWCLLFDRWMVEGCPRLHSTKGSYALTRIGASTLSLSVAIPLANGAETAWIERLPTAPQIREYEVYLRPALPGVTQPSRVTHHIEDITDGAVSEVFVRDQDGRQLLSITN